MTNKTKALGLAFIAVVAMSAVAAQAAQAASLDVGTQPAVITAHSDPSQEHSLSIPLTGSGTITAGCPTASFEGTVQGQTDITETTITATYGGGTGCKISGLAATVKMNGCKYTITDSGVVRTVLIDIVGCTAGKQIEITQTATGCVITIPEQNGLAHLVLNQVSAQEVTNQVTVTGITFTENASCPNPNHHGSNATATGNTTMTAWTDKGTDQVTKHGHQYSEHTCGTQVSLTAT